jgi:LPPG:FO 2-phospho-L-lactate transferase
MTTADAPSITVLAGGVGAARFLAGLAQVVPPSSITAICNVGDDLEWHGLHVSPDIDTVIYTLAGIEGELGWGIDGDTLTTLDELRRLHEGEWFTIGDRDLATHLLRHDVLASGGTLSEATARLCDVRGVETRVLPVTDDPHPTIVETDAGELPFQVYFVQRHAQDSVVDFHFPGAGSAQPAPGVLEALAEADAVVLAPSNPFVSIDPLLRVAGAREALAGTSATRVAVSPIVGGAAIKGPAADMLAALAHEVSALGVARLYRGLIDCFVLDERDAELAPAVEALGMRAVATDTMMTGDEGRARVAANVLAAAGLEVTA